jgi:carbonic anhydrase/acetyltransferase-like protein (isoleucine patch superfamily)
MQLFRKTAGDYFVAHNRTLTGELSIAALSSFWFNAVVRGDVAPIAIGQRVNVQDGAAIHCDSGVPNVVEDDATIGHRAVAHGTFVGRGRKYMKWLAPHYVALAERHVSGEIEVEQTD